MSEIKSFPKIFAVGAVAIPNLLKGEVEITEKLDGSMFGFGVDASGNVVMRTKNQQIFFESHPKMFENAVNQVQRVVDEGLLTGTLQEIYFYGEYFDKPKHNILAYSRIPKNHIALFGMYYDGNFKGDYQTLRKVAEQLNLDVVPLLGHSRIGSLESFMSLLDTDSVLGGAKIEGIVIKNYNELTLPIGGHCWPSFAKYVSERFKEKHSKENYGKSKDKFTLEGYIQGYKTEARWLKAIHHTRDEEALEYSPRDIGKLIPKIQQDILEEETENIKRDLFNMFKKRILGSSVAGFPEFYKHWLAEKQFEGVENVTSEPN